MLLCACSYGLPTNATEGMREFANYYMNTWSVPTLQVYTELNYITIELRIYIVYCMYVCMCICVCMYVCVFVYVCMCVYLYVCMYVYNVSL